MLDRDVLLEQVAQQLERVVDRAIDVEVDDALVVGARVVVERRDDRLGALRAALDDAHHVADVLRGLAARRRVGAVDVADRLLERADRVDDRVDRVVDLVRDAGDELTDRGQLLGAHELLLRARQLVERLGELAVLAREVGGAHLHRALEVEVDLLGRAQLVAQRAPHLLEREREPADLVALAARRDRIGELAARHRVGALLEPADRRHELRDRERDDAGARAEQHEEEDEQLLERPHHRLAAAAVARVEHRDRAEVVARAAARSATRRPDAPGELGGVDRDQRRRRALDLRAHVPRQLRRAHRPAADGEQLVAVRRRSR